MFRVLGIDIYILGHIFLVWILLICPIPFCMPAHHLNNAETCSKIDLKDFCYFFLKKGVRFYMLYVLLLSNLYVLSNELRLMQIYKLLGCFCIVTMFEYPWYILFVIQII